MSIEGQPNTILTEYSPFAWVEDTGSFITFPTAQNRAITFPNVVDIGNSVTRAANINIGSNTSVIAGQTPGNVNIMCGAGRQEGSFNVLTNTNNRGVINLGNISANGSINILCNLGNALRIGYDSSTYTNEDRFIGSSKSMTYVNVGFTALAGNLYVFGNISTLVSTGTYQVNLKVSLASTNAINPYLKVGLYTKTGATAWVDGAILTGGTLIDASYWVGKAHAPALNDLFTIQVSGIATFTAKQQVCVGLGYNTGTGQLSGGSLLSLVRIG